jgi:hypothetical protein
VQRVRRLPGKSRAGPVACPPIALCGHEVNVLAFRRSSPRPSCSNKLTTRPLATMRSALRRWPTADSQSGSRGIPGSGSPYSPLYVASSASLQGWDALMQCAYSQAPFTGIESPSNWAAFNDPAPALPPAPCSIAVRTCGSRHHLRIRADPGPTLQSPHLTSEFRCTAHRGRKRGN